MPHPTTPFDREALVRLRVAAELTQVQLAARVGARPPLIPSYEGGHRTPGPDMLVKLAAALQCTPQELCTVSPEKVGFLELRLFAGLQRGQAVRQLASLLAAKGVRVTDWQLRVIEEGRPLTVWKAPEVATSVVEALAAVYGRPVSALTAIWARTYPHSVPAVPAQSLEADVVPHRGTKALLTWESLNQRQRTYLTAIFREDQEAEAHASASRAAWRDPGPAADWRKLPFTVKADPTLTGYTTVQDRLREEGEHDSGAGATLQALRRRSLVQVTEDQVEVFPVGFVPRVLVELTRLGRACARAGLGVPRTSRLPSNLLSQWLWNNLAKVAAAEPDGLAQEGLPGRSRFYLGTGYRPHGSPSRGLIDTVAVPVDATRRGSSSTYVWRLTDVGRRHIAEHLATYQELYPEDPIRQREP